MKVDVRVLLPDDFGDPRCHDADEFALVLDLEAFHVAEPADGVADGSDGELNHDFAVLRVEIMRENRFFSAFVVNDETEADEEFFDAGDIGSGDGVLAEENDSCVDVGEGHVILFPVVREEDADAVVEVEFDAFNCVLRGDLGDFSVDGWLLRLLLRGLFRSRCGRRGLGGGLRGYKNIILHIQILCVWRDGEIVHEYSPD